MAPFGVCSLQCRAHYPAAIPSIIHIGILVFDMPGLLLGPDALTAVILYHTNSVYEYIVNPYIYHD
jgi:hypothetical protein